MPQREPGEPHREHQGAGEVPAQEPLASRELKAVAPATTASHRRIPEILRTEPRRPPPPQGVQAASPPEETKYPARLWPSTTAADPRRRAQRDMERRAGVRESALTTCSVVGAARPEQRQPGQQGRRAPQHRTCLVSVAACSDGLRETRPIRSERRRQRSGHWRRRSTRSPRLKVRPRQDRRVQQAVVEASLAGSNLQAAVIALSVAANA